MDSFCNSLYNNLYIQGSKEVFYAGDVHSAKEEVSGLIRTLGFSPIDRGALRNAREIEDIPVQRFPLWKTPLIISTVLFTVLFLLSFSKWVTFFFFSPEIYLVWCFIESQTTFTIYGSHLLFATRKDYVCKLDDSGFFKNFLYQGGVKSIVSWVFKDLKFKISEGTPIWVLAYWNSKLKVLKYPKNCRLHATLI